MFLISAHFRREDNIIDCPFIEDNSRQLKINEIQTQRWRKERKNGKKSHDVGERGNDENRKSKTIVLRKMLIFIASIFSSRVPSYCFLWLENTSFSVLTRCMLDKSTSIGSKDYFLNIFSMFYVPLIDLSFEQRTVFFFSLLLRTLSTSINIAIQRYLMINLLRTSCDWTLVCSVLIKNDLPNYPEKLIIFHVFSQKAQIKTHL